MQSFEVNDVEQKRTAQLKIDYNKIDVFTIIFMGYS